MRLGLAPYMDATFPIFFDSVKIVTHYPKVENRSDALIAIYSKTVHLCLCLELGAVHILRNEVGEGGGGGGGSGLCDVTTGPFSQLSKKTRGKNFS